LGGRARPQETSSRTTAATGKKPEMRNGVEIPGLFMAWRLEAIRAMLSTQNMD